jgi:integrase
MQSNTVTIKPVRHPNYKWRVYYPDGGVRKGKYFKTKTGRGGAEAWASAKRQELADYGNREVSITNEERRAVNAFREAVAKLPGEGVSASLAEATEHYLKHLILRHKSMTCEEVADKLLGRLAKEGKSKRHIDDMTSRLKRFNTEYGEWLACDVSTEVVDDFLHHLNLKPQTCINYRSKIHQMFAHAVKVGAALSNPVTDAINPKVVGGEPGILKPTQVAKLLSCADDETLPGLAVSFFAGVRRAEVERLDWSEIDMEQGHIEIKTEKAKTAKRRLIPISNNLKEWLLPFYQHEGPVCVSHSAWRLGCERARDAAKLKEWPSNAARHSFASYHLAMHQDAGKTAMALGHPDPRLLFDRYRALVTPKAAETYWAITPTKEGNITHINEAC